MKSDIGSQAETKGTLEKPSMGGNNQDYANLQVSLGKLAFIFHHLSLGPKPSLK